MVQISVAIFDTDEGYGKRTVLELTDADLLDSEQLVERFTKPMTLAVLDQFRNSKGRP